MSEDIGLRRETSGALLRITIDRPARANAIDRAMLRTLGEWLLEAMRDDDLRALVLTGAGDRVFSAGADALWPTLASL